MIADPAGAYSRNVYLRERLDRLTSVTWDDAMVSQLIETIAPNDTWKQAAYRIALEYRLRLGVSKG